MSAGRKINTSSQSWGTPKKYVDVVNKFFDGVIELDPCSNVYSIVNAKKEYLLPENDGLKESWNYSTIYVNPPYGRNKNNKTSIKNWLEKCSMAKIDYGSEVLALVPVATNTSHWKNFVFTKATAICFLNDTRLRFLENGEDCGKGAPMACAMVYWGLDYQKFYNVFINFGAVVNISNLIIEEKRKDSTSKDIKHIVKTPYDLKKMLSESGMKVISHSLNKLDEDDFYKNFSKEFINICTREHFELGFSCESEIFLKNNLESEPRHTASSILKMFNEYKDDDSMIIYLLRILYHNTNECLLSDTIKNIMRYCINSKNIEVLEYIIRCCENFRDEESLKLLESKNFNIDWLDDYKNTIINELREELKNN